jgi:hypothetical protein
MGTPPRHRQGGLRRGSDPYHCAEPGQAKRRLPAWLAGQSFAAAALPVAWWIGALDTMGRAGSGLLMVALALTLGILDSVGAAIGSSTLCDLAESEMSGGAGRTLGVDDLASRVSRLIGPVAAASLAAWIDTASVLALDSVTFAVGAVLASAAVSGLPRAGPAGTSASLKAKGRSSLWPPAVRDVLGRRPDIRAVWRLRGTGCFVWDGYSVGIPLLVTSIPGPDAAQFATVSAGYAAATLLGSALIAVRPPQKGLVGTRQRHDDVALVAEDFQGKCVCDRLELAPDPLVDVTFKYPGLSVGAVEVRAELGRVGCELAVLIQSFDLLADRGAVLLGVEDHAAEPVLEVVHILRGSGRPARPRPDRSRRAGSAGAPDASGWRQSVRRPHDPSTWRAPYLLH